MIGVIKFLDKSNPFQLNFDSYKSNMFLHTSPKIAGIPDEFFSTLDFIVNTLQIGLYHTEAD